MCGAPAALLALALASVPLLTASGADAPAAGTAPGERIYVVRTAHPERRTLSQSIKKTGGLFSPAVVDVSAKITGRLLTLELEDGTRVEEGTHVKRGALIATLDSRDYVAQKHAADAALQSARATLADKQRERVRAELLFKEGSATEQERDRTLADHERAVAAVEQAQAQVRSRGSTSTRPAWWLPWTAWSRRAMPSRAPCCPPVPRWSPSRKPTSCASR